jgi:hypothetical protein
VRYSNHQEIARRQSISERPNDQTRTRCALVPCVAYLQARRLTRAVEILARGAPDILAVALESDYGSHEAFTRTFGDQASLRHTPPPPKRLHRRTPNAAAVGASRLNAAMECCSACLLYLNRLTQRHWACSREAAIGQDRISRPAGSSFHPRGTATSAHKCAMHELGHARYVRPRVGFCAP